MLLLDTTGKLYMGNQMNASLTFNPEPDITLKSEGREVI